MSSIKYAVSLFTDQQWSWGRDEVKDILLSAQARFEQGDEECECGRFAGANGEQMSIAPVKR